MGGGALRYENRSAQVIQLEPELGGQVTSSQVSVRPGVEARHDDEGVAVAAGFRGEHAHGDIHLAREGLEEGLHLRAPLPPSLRHVVQGVAEHAQAIHA